MAAVVVYDPLDSDIANRVTFYGKSVNTPAYDAETNKLVNPDVSSLSAVPVRHWKYDGISAIVEMSQAEKDLVDPIVTKFGATSGLFDGEIAITEDAAWQNLGGRVTNIANLVGLLFGHADLTRAKGRVPFRVKAVGSGVEVRLMSIEADGTETSLLVSAHAVGDTSDLWEFQSFTTDVTPPSGDRLFCLQGRLNGATSATISHAAMTLLDVG